jgi:EpsD family peptidyl-prolyl cis-trans isomerase
VGLKVNDHEVSVHQIELALQAQPRAAVPAQAASATAAALSALVDQELAAQAAVAMGLDRDPRLVQRLTAARRQLLAQAYQEQVGSRAADPATDEIDRYRDEHPELFAQRRLYQLQETLVAAPPGGLAALQRIAQAAASPAELAVALRRAELRSSVRYLTVSAEDVPLHLLRDLASLKDGGSLVLPHDAGARVLTLLGAQPAPIPRDTAQRLVGQYLANQKKQQVIGDAMNALRRQARVEYLGPYAAIGGGAAAAATVNAPPSNTAAPPAPAPERAR